MTSSRKPLRDLGLALACFVATLAVTLAIVAGVKNGVLPDNRLTVGVLMLLIFAGIAGILFYVRRHWASFVWAASEVVESARALTGTWRPTAVRRVSRLDSLGWCQAWFGNTQDIHKGGSAIEAFLPSLDM
jgi:hypothetical protein